MAFFGNFPGLRGLFEPRIGPRAGATLEGFRKNAARTGRAFTNLFRRGSTRLQGLLLEFSKIVSDLAPESAGRRRTGLI
jgi:hypothetical protein